MVSENLADPAFSFGFRSCILMLIPCWFPLRR